MTERKEDYVLVGVPFVPQRPELAVVRVVRVCEKNRNEIVQEFVAQAGNIQARPFILPIFDYAAVLQKKGRGVAQEA